MVANLHSKAVPLDVVWRGWGGGWGGRFEVVSFGVWDRVFKSMSMSCGSVLAGLLCWGCTLC